MNMLVNLNPCLITSDELQDPHLTADELEAKYAGGEHPIFQIADWVAAGTQYGLDYWGWVRAMLARQDLDPRDMEGE